jgi:hypothetical protein
MNARRSPGELVGKIVGRPGIGKGATASGTPPDRLMSWSTTAAAFASCSNHWTMRIFWCSMSSFRKSSAMNSNAEVIFVGLEADDENNIRQLRQ